MIKCPHCSYPNSPAADECAQCHLPVASSAASTTAVASLPEVHIAEGTHWWIVITGWGAILTGIGVFLWAADTPDAGPIGVLIAVVAIAAGAVSLFVSNHGQRWESLGSAQRAAIIPAVAASLAVVLTVGLAIAIVVVALRGYRP